MSALDEPFAHAPFVLGRDAARLHGNQHRGDGCGRCSNQCNGQDATLPLAGGRHSPPLPARKPGLSPHLHARRVPSLFDEHLRAALGLGVTASADRKVACFAAAPVRREIVLFSSQPHLHSLSAMDAHALKASAEQRTRDRLFAEERASKLPGLPRREPRLREHLHDLICELSLLWRKRGRIGVPAETSQNIGLDPRIRWRELVRKLVQVAHLLEQRLELPIVDRHDRAKGTPLDESYALAPLVLPNAQSQRVGVLDSPCRTAAGAPSVMWGHPQYPSPVAPLGYVEATRRTPAVVLADGPDRASRSTERAS